MYCKEEMERQIEYGDRDEWPPRDRVESKPRKIADVVKAATSELPPDNEVMGVPSTATLDRQDAEQKSDEPQPQAESHLSECRNFCNEMVGNPRNKMTWAGSSNGIEKYNLPNGELLMFGDSCQLQGSVDTLRPDALNAVDAIVSRAITQAERKQ
jgi:hypothetical protein